MTEENDKKDPQLTDLLRGARVSPPLPPRFQQNVWRRIETAEAPPKSVSCLEALAALVLRPRFAVSAAVVLLAAGVLAGTVEGRQAAQQKAEMTYVASVAPLSSR